MLISLAVNKRASIKLKQGYPWVFLSDCHNIFEAKHLAPGTMVHFTDLQQNFLGVCSVNPISTIFGRILSWEAVNIDTDFFSKKIERALTLRSRFFTTDYYRLVHSEADGLPGLTVDRLGKILVVQITTAGMEQWQEKIIHILKKLFPVQQLLLKNDAPIRLKEQLPLQVETLVGNAEFAWVYENNCQYQVNLYAGQKTGWFYDQRENRAWVAMIAQGKTVLDAFCYVGGFGVAALKHGATAVTFIDSASATMELVASNVKYNQCQGHATYITQKAFPALEQLVAQKATFDLVCLDPPAYIKSKKDQASGLKGYQKLAKLGALLAAPNGIMVFSSCSHHAQLADLIEHVALGIGKAKRKASILKISGAALDHPIHPVLPESQYLKTLMIQLD
jgi:23S rRNA (cytosine1962-C5)-methyltransferase